MIDLPTLSLDDGLAEMRKLLLAKIAGTGDERERQFYLLQLALTEPFQRWLFQAIHFLPPDSIIQIVCEVLGNGAHAVLCQAGVIDNWRIRELAIGEFRRSLEHGRPVFTCSIALTNA